MNNKGVTLIELLIVIVVLGIIAAFAVPAVGDIISGAEKDAVIQDARAIADQARYVCGQGLPTTAQCATGDGTANGMTYAQLISYQGLDVFDATQYDNTNGTASTVVVYKNASGIWVVQLTPDAAGDYGFGGNATTAAYADPVTATDNDVYVGE